MRLLCQLTNVADTVAASCMVCWLPIPANLSHNDYEKLKILGMPKIGQRLLAQYSLHKSAALTDGQPTWNA